MKEGEDHNPNSNCQDTISPESWGCPLSSKEPVSLASGPEANPFGDRPVTDPTKLWEEDLEAQQVPQELSRLGIVHVDTEGVFEKEVSKFRTKDKVEDWLKMEIQSLHPVVKSFLIGSTSGALSTVLFQPLDLLKTRLQQSTPSLRTGMMPGMASASTVSGVSPGTSPKSFFGLLTQVVKNEKLFGLWRGMTPSLTRCVPGVGLYFASLHTLKRVMGVEGDPTAKQSFILGVTCRSFSGVVLIPFTVIKTRFESPVYKYNGIMSALTAIYSNEGTRGLTRGLLATLLRDAPFSGIYLTMFTTAKRSVPKEWLDSDFWGAYVRFSCGVAAGIGSSIVTQPADVIKTKMQLYPNECNRLLSTAHLVYKKYGPQGYFKGLMPRMMRRTLIAAMSWTLYEQLMRSMGLK